MSKIDPRYIQDIQDSFWDKVTQKQAKSIVWDMKNIQSSLLPTKKFKTWLIERLESIHVMDDALDAPVQFSFLRVFSTIFSFVFVFWVVFVFFDAHKKHSESIFHYDTPMYEQHPASQRWTEDNSDIQENKDSVLWVPSFEDAEHSKISDEIHSKISTQHVIEREEISISQETEQPEPSQVPIETQKTETLLDRWASGRQLQDSFLYEIEESSGDMESSEGMMMDMSADESSQEQSFREICEEYGGNLSDDEMLCFIPKDKICSENNIHSCAQE